MISLKEFFCIHEEEWSPSEIPGTDKIVCKKECGMVRYVYDDGLGG